MSLEKLIEIVAEHLSLLRIDNIDEYNKIAVDYMQNTNYNQYTDLSLAQYIVNVNDKYNFLYWNKDSILNELPTITDENIKNKFLKKKLLKNLVVSAKCIKFASSKSNKHIHKHLKFIHYGKFQFNGTKQHRSS